DGSRTVVDLSPVYAGGVIRASMSSSLLPIVAGEPARRPNGDSAPLRPKAPEGDTYSSASAASSAPSTVRIGRRTATSVALATFSRATLFSISLVNGVRESSKDVTSEYWSAGTRSSTHSATRLGETKCLDRHSNDTATIAPTSIAIVA